MGATPVVVAGTGMPHGRGRAVAVFRYLLAEERPRHLPAAVHRRKGRETAALFWCSSSSAAGKQRRKGATWLLGWEITIAGLVAATATNGGSMGIITTSCPTTGLPFPSQNRGQRGEGCCCRTPCVVDAVMLRPNTARISCRRRWHARRGMFLLPGLAEPPHGPLSSANLLRKKEAASLGGPPCSANIDRCRLADHSGGLHYTATALRKTKPIPDSRDQNQT
nr:hypothetical protein Itr_chr05CG12730 [Ipomoea trifida]